MFSTLRPVAHCGRIRLALDTPPPTRLRRPGTAATAVRGDDDATTREPPPPPSVQRGQPQRQDTTRQRSYTGVAGPAGGEATTTCTTWQRTLEVFGA